MRHLGLCEKGIGPIAQTPFPIRIFYGHGIYTLLIIKRVFYSFNQNFSNEKTLTNPVAPVIQRGVADGPAGDHR